MSRTHQYPHRAWYVTRYDDWDAGCAVVFADTRGQARARGVHEVDADDLTQIRAVRLPPADGLRPCDLTDRWYIEHGMTAVCAWCDRAVNQDNLTDGELFFVGRNSRVYCSPSCLAARTADIAWRQQRDDRAALRRAYMEMVGPGWTGQEQMR